MTENTESLVALGQRLTGPRRAVLDAIAASGAPFTVEDICAAAPAVGRATVFRTVKMLQEREIVCRVPLEDGSVRYQLSEGGHHHHLVCRVCGAVEEFGDPDLDRLIQQNAGTRRFELDGHSLELYGRCRACAAP
jgi:Fe2+ or Zn2+ uptake regulation protein